VNEVWATDIPIKLPGGMVYFTAVIDLYSRKILSWSLSNTMDTNSVWIAFRKP
jgi:putative transposase